LIEFEDDILWFFVEDARGKVGGMGDGRRVAGDGRRETRDGRQETGDKRRETGDGKGRRKREAALIFGFIMESPSV
jgi:hypothetical protein